jgi:hypothetical protein
MEKKPSEKRTAEVVWLSPEQVAAALVVPAATIRQWARDGDPRVPAYRVWDERDGSHGRFRFKQSDVEAFQALPPTPEPVPSDPVAAPVRARRSPRAASGATRKQA